MEEGGWPLYAIAFGGRTSYSQWHRQFRRTYLLLLAASSVSEGMPLIAERQRYFRRTHLLLTAASSISEDVPLTDGSIASFGGRTSYYQRGFGGGTSVATLLPPQGGLDVTGATSLLPSGSFIPARPGAHLVRRGLGDVNRRSVRVFHTVQSRGLHKASFFPVMFGETFKFGSDPTKHGQRTRKKTSQSPKPVLRSGVAGLADI